MKVNNIKIEHFRNFTKADLEFSENVNILYGNNGSGKTNILEAIFVLALSRSPRTVTDSVMVNDESEYYRLEGSVKTGDRIHLISTAFQKEAKKKITIDKVNSKASELFRMCTVVSIAPDDLEILSGAPSKRRDFINMYLSQASEKYLENLGNYQRVLAQKNAYLKREVNNITNPFDDLLVQYGALIIKARMDFLNSVGEYANKHYDKISKGQELEILYKPSVPIESESDSLESIMNSFTVKLDSNRERERFLQTAIIGPHRDEIGFSIKGYPARTHGSQGELRSAAIALKFAVFEYLKDVRRETPVLLLDEVFAELDDSRKEMLVDMFNNFGQVFTTTASEIPESLANNAQTFKIEKGTVKAV